MAAKTTLSDLRNRIQEIYREVTRTQGDGEAPNAAVLKVLWAENNEELRVLNRQLVNIALTKLLNDVSNRSGFGGASSSTPDLFSEFGVPRFVTITRGKKKDIAKLSYRDALLYLKAHSEKAATDRHDPLRRLLDACGKYARSDDDTLETLVRRKMETEQPNVL
jgi:hypothetical protein